MPWPGTMPWVEKTAAELRPVIVSLCNAVNDRRECIGLNRNAWTVNTDQSIYDVTVGTKSTALVEDDLYGLEIFRYDWWGQIATQITTLVGLGTATPDASSFDKDITHCGGWSKTDDGTGHGTGLWTMADLESDVGLGDVDDSVVGGTKMHLFDEVAPNRFREMLDRLIYPVIFPYNHAITELSGEEAAERASDNESNQELDPDDAWDSATDDVFSPAFNGILSGSVGPSGTSPRVRGKHKDIAYLMLDFENCQNGVGCIGDIAKQILRFGATHTTLAGIDFEVLSSGANFAGTSGFSYVDIEDCDLLPALTGIYSVLFSMVVPTGSPFSGSGGAYTKIGATAIAPVFMFQTPSIASGTGIGGGTNRDEQSRLILDITAYVYDQT